MVAVMWIVAACLGCAGLIILAGELLARPERHPVVVTKLVSDPHTMRREAELQIRVQWLEAELESLGRAHESAVSAADEWREKWLARND